MKPNTASNIDEPFEKNLIYLWILSRDRYIIEPRMLLASYTRKIIFIFSITSVVFYLNKNHHIHHSSSTLEIYIETERERKSDRKRERVRRITIAKIYCTQPQTHAHTQIHRKHKLPIN